MSIYTIQSRLCNTFQLIFETVLFVILHDCPVQQHCSWWHLAFVGLTIKTRCLKLSLYILFDKKKSFLTDHTVFTYPACTLKRPPRLFLKMLPICVLLSCLSKLDTLLSACCTHIHIHTHTHLSSPIDTILLHQNFCGILKLPVQISCFNKLLFYS